MDESTTAQSQVHLIPARAIDLGAVVRLPDGRLGWLWKGRGRDPYRVTCGDVGESVRATDGLEVVRWPAQLAVEWIESQDPPATTQEDVCFNCGGTQMGCCIATAMY